MSGVITGRGSTIPSTNFLVLHNATAASDIPIYIAFDLTTRVVTLTAAGVGPGNACLWFDSAFNLYLADSYAHDTTTFSVTHDAAAAANGTQVFAHLSMVLERGSPRAMFQSVTATGNHSYFSDTCPFHGNVLTDTSEKWGVIHNDHCSAQYGGFPVYVREGDSKLVITNPEERDIYVTNCAGRVLTLYHDATASANPILYFNANNITPANRLIFVSGSATSRTITTSEWSTIAPMGVLYATLYINEAAANPESKLIQNFFPTDVYLPAIGANQQVKIAYDANAAVNGVPVYYNQANNFSNQALEFVSPTASDCTVYTSSNRRPDQQRI